MATTGAASSERVPSAPIGSRSALLVMQLDDLPMGQIEHVRLMVSRIEQLDRLAAKGPAEKRDLPLLTYRQMQELSPMLRRDEQVFRRIVQIEEATARSRGMTREQLMASPTRYVDCEVVSKRLVNQSEMRQNAFKALKTFVDKSVNTDAAKQLLERFEQKPAFVPPVRPPSLHAQRPGYRI